MRVHNTARYRVREDATQATLEAIGTFVATVRAREPGALMYVAWQERVDPTAFVHTMTFEDEAAEEAHSGSEWVRAFTDVVYPLTVDGVTFTGYDEVASA